MDYKNKKERISKLFKNGGFRAKSLLEGEEWIYGHYYNVDDSLKGKTRHIIVHETSGSGLQVRHDPIDIDTLGQYTGKLDKDNTKVYEDDILENSKKEKFVVYWNNGVGSWYNKPIDENLNSYPAFNTGTLKNLKVIGNTHANPEIAQSGEQITMEV